MIPKPYWYLTVRVCFYHFVVLPLSLLILVK